jgi:peptidoglycan hydrolase-like protein with peptidoglycan-binding domain
MPEPDVAIKSLEGGPLIKIRRNHIAEIQKLLLDLGYFLDDDEGTFGESTREALRKFKSKYGFVKMGEINESAAEELACIFKLSILAKENFELIDALQDGYNRGIINDCGDLATLNLESWYDLIHDSNIPEDIPGDTKEERTQNYAKLLYKMAHELFGKR